MRHHLENLDMLVMGYISLISLLHPGVKDARSTGRSPDSRFELDEKLLTPAASEVNNDEYDPSR